MGHGGGTCGQKVPSSQGVTGNFSSFPGVPVSVQPSSLPDSPGQSQSSGDREPQQWGEEQLPGKILTSLWLPVLWGITGEAAEAQTSTAHSNPDRSRLAVFVPDTWGWFGLSNLTEIFQKDFPSPFGCWQGTLPTSPSNVEMHLQQQGFLESLKYSRQNHTISKPCHSFDSRYFNN